MKNYSIGIDIGTTSVGWAVIDRNTYQIMRKGNKKLWGVRLFEPANTAEARRMARSTRRRYQRRRKRIQLLQEEFRSAINEVDSQFFQKMQESFYQADDIQNKKIPITQEEQKEIIKYYKMYPTIYHLRKELMETNDKMDIRLVYLAIHHIIKYRGNFLYETSNFNVQNLNLEEKIEEIFTRLVQIETLDVTEENISLIDIEKVKAALLETSKNDKKVYLKEALNQFLPKSFVDEFNNLMLGNKAKINKLLAIETEEEIKLSFQGEEKEEVYSKLETILGDDFELILLIQELYHMVFLKNLFRGSDNANLSSLMVNRYHQHEEDLAQLKELFRQHRPTYRKLFRNKINRKKEELCLYERYIRNQLSFQEFSNQLKPLLTTMENYVEDHSLINCIKEKIAEENLLPRITDTDNGKYPFQLNMDELVKIIENQGKYYPFLLDKTSDGSYKLVKLLAFRIPYYVGPLNNTTTSAKHENKNAWMVRKQPVAITPYNFEEVVDLDASAEKFITRMIANCTYLMKEKVMPANSLLYSKFKVLNELKQIKINGYKLSLESQKRIFQELFLKETGTITEKKFKDYLRSSGQYDMYNEIMITGYSAEHKFANNMQSYIDFFGPNGIFTGSPYVEKDAEQIISWITIFEDKKILKRKIQQNFPKLTEEQLKLAITKRYKGWSSLSEKLLIMPYYLDPETHGNKKSIMDLMEETDQNFMQIINEKKYHFQDMIKEQNPIEENSILNYELVNELATSPANKRGIYQALKVIKEIVDYMGYEPDNIVLETARGDEKKLRTTDKKKMLENLYSSLTLKIENYNTLKKQLTSYEKIDSQKLFLYFIQEGKSLYSGKPFNIEDLPLYEIDHIIPQTLIKDDSIDNKALVFREENQIKAASFVLPKEYRTESMKKWWQHLKNNGLMSAKKFHNLCRDFYSEEDIEGFINRQLVETRQITKHVANIVNNFYKKSNVIYLPAALAHNYREKFELFKFREINDFHHTHDAYLAAVLGEYRFNILKHVVNFEQLKELNYKLLENKKYKDLHYGYIINSLDNSLLNYDENGEILFDIPKFNQTIENTLYQNDILISKKTEIKTGQFYQETKNKRGENGVSLKANLPTTRYGSYTRIEAAYIVLIKYTKKKKEQQRLIGIPVYLMVKNANQTEIIAYIRNLLSLTMEDKIEIIKDKIPFHTKLNWEGQICYLVGASDNVEVCNAKELKIEKENMKNWKYTFKRLLHKKESIIETDRYQKQLEDIIRYIIDKIEKEFTLYYNLVDQLKALFCYSDMSKLTLEEKENIVIQMLHLLRCNSENANLKFLGASSAFGKKNGRIIDHAIVINQSTTGLRERTYEL